MSPSKQTVCIIGSLGYLGHHLESHLSQSNFSVTGLDLHNLEQAKVLIAEANSIILANGLSDHLLGKKDPWLDHQRNVSNSLTYLHMDEFRSKKVIHLSSLCVYGVPEGLVDEQSPARPVEPQAYSKLYLETMLSHIARLRDLDVLNFRISTIIGQKRKRDPLSFLEKICLASTAGKVTEVYGGKKRPIAYTPVQDFLQCMEVLLNLESFPSNCFNLARHQCDFLKLKDNFLIEFVESPKRSHHIISDWALRNATSIEYPEEDPILYLLKVSEELNQTYRETQSEAL